VTITTLLADVATPETARSQFCQRIASGTVTPEGSAVTANRTTWLGDKPRADDCNHADRNRLGGAADRCRQLVFDDDVKHLSGPAMRLVRD
jgi:hypothetical protein